MVMFVLYSHLTSEFNENTQTSFSMSSHVHVDSICVPQSITMCLNALRYERLLYLFNLYMGSIIW